MDIFGSFGNIQSSDDIKKYLGTDPDVNKYWQLCMATLEKSILNSREVFEKTKYTLDVATFGFILDGTKRNPSVPKRYHAFINTMYKMNAKEALATFKKINRV